MKPWLMGKGRERGWGAAWLGCCVAGVLRGRSAAWPECCVAGVLSGWSAAVGVSWEAGRG